MAKNLQTRPCKSFDNLQVIYWRRHQIVSLPYPEPDVTPVAPAQLPLPAADPEGLRGMRRRMCKFCKNNGEAAATYFSHNLRCPVTDKLICPVLRKHTCEVSCSVAIVPRLMYNLQRF